MGIQADISRQRKQAVPRTKKIQDRESAFVFLSANLRPQKPPSLAKLLKLQRQERTSHKPQATFCDIPFSCQPQAAELLQELARNFSSFYLAGRKQSDWRVIGEWLENDWRMLRLTVALLAIVGASVAWTPTGVGPAWTWPASQGKKHTRSVFSEISFHWFR